MPSAGCPPTARPPRPCSTSSGCRSSAGSFRWSCTTRPGVTRRSTRPPRRRATWAAAGGTYFVTAAISSHAAWERPELGTAEWAHLFAMLTELDQITADHGLVQAVHPHVNTLIETASEVDRFIDNCASPFTLDTGHLYLGGADPVMIARRHHERVALVHIKDIDARVAQMFLSGTASLMDSVATGLFPNAGDGVAPIAATVDALHEVGYCGWYVLEQDITLTGDLPAPGEGPVLGVRSSIEYLRSLDA
ncbi:MAG: sugar phosphate isomerase/epimerase [Ilumatobacteraceae bacterium]